MAQVTKEALQALVKALCTRSSEDIEKVLLHILDTSRAWWNRKATEYLRQLKDRDLDGDSLKQVQANYKHALEQTHRISKMRYGIAKPKRQLGESIGKKVNHGS